MSSLAELMADRIAESLRRKSLSSCSRWACACRVMGKPFPGPWTFKHHPWLREMHDSLAEMNVGQKSAQMGYTEFALNRTFYAIDIENTDVLYVLPAKTPDASDFSAARFDPALELSPHLSNLFSDVKNVGHKRAGTANLYIRGSKSRSGLKSIPTGLIILDEVDEMAQENIPLAMERAAGQIEKQIWAISTPTIENVGINKLFISSTQEHFMFTCPACSRTTEFSFPESFEVIGEDLTDPRIGESHLKCKECKAKLEHANKIEFLEKAFWAPTFANRDTRGFHIGQMYSSTVKPLDFVKSYFKSLNDPSDEQEFYNSKLGVPHVVSGAQITDGDIDKCLKGHKKGKPASGLITMGVDVGKWLHYWIDQWSLGKMIGADVHSTARCRTIDYGKLLNFSELDDLFRLFGIHACVIDANPERRAALQFANRFYGRVKTCFYGQGLNGKEIQVHKEEQHTISVDRTSWLDLSLGRIRQETIDLPMDINPEVRQHMKALVRIYKKDKDGNLVGRYENGYNDDHYAHSRNYSEIALTFAASFGSPQNIEKII